ncbi:MAG: hypothetical protein E7A11_13995 [Clostridium sp.]|uniref:hypothetical protein n=1 Tax=Clostridium sp. TaxID=1506 RepID=UPI002901AD14|nr:hypothetical protein [Clostridium sp.]MDU1078267.1 hypothetical protein [Clostridium sp.]MDU1126387.1 hypothetical protein [Clostridium sp.]
MKLDELNINKKYIIAIICIILLPIVILCAVKLTPSNRNISKLNNIGKKIESCNEKLKDCLDDNGINSDTTKETLTNELIELSNIQSTLDSTNVLDQNKELKTKLSETLEYNINLYQLTLSIIKNPNSTEILQTYNEYTQTYELLKNNYDTLRLLGLDIEFPSEAEEFFTTSTTFINTLIKLNRENDIKVSQKSTYILNLEDCIEVLNYIKEDLRPALAKIREDGRSLDNLLKDVKDKRSKFNELKSKTYSFSIPENGNDCYQVLQDTLNYYELYITSLEHSIVVEKTSTEKDKDDNIDINYENSFEKYEDFTDSLKDLKSELDNFNNK